MKKLLRIFKKQQKEIYLTLGLNSVKYIQTKVYGLYDISKAQLCYSNALNLYITDYKQNPNDYIAYRLGNMYLKGLGTDMNINQAIYWFSEAEKI